MRHPKHTLIPIYYLVLLSAVVAAMIGYFLAVSKGVRITDQAVVTPVYSVILIYVIASIPFSFWLFSKKLKDIRLIEDKDVQYKEYVRYASIRLILIAVGIVASVICYFLFANMSLFWLAGVEAIAAIICKPTPRRVNNDLDVGDEITNN